MTLELIIAFVPSVVVFLTAYFVIRQSMKNEQIKRSLDNKFLVQKEIILLRLQAYERMILFLERITPANLVMRLDKEGLSAAEFHLHLLMTIRAEYEHNLAQQLYVSNEAWQTLINAKEELIKLINIAKENLQDENNAFNLSRAILGSVLEKQSPTVFAIDFIKKEAASLF